MKQSSYQKLKMELALAKMDKETYQNALLEIAKMRGPNVVKAPEIAQKALFGSAWLKK